MVVSETARDGNRTKVRRPATRFPGIVAAAAQLGVTRVYLWKVLVGDERNVELLKRYRALKCAGGGLKAAAKTAVAGPVQAASTGHPEGNSKAA